MGLLTLVNEPLCVCCTPLFCSRWSEWRDWLLLACLLYTVNCYVHSVVLCIHLAQVIFVHCSAGAATRCVTYVRQWTKLEV